MDDQPSKDEKDKDEDELEESDPRHLSEEVTLAPGQKPPKAGEDA